jgi:enoyl-CoA hydratase
VRLVLLRGEGRHFCSGFHIDAVPGVDAPALFESLCQAWEQLPAVTLAVLHGGVWGGATDLALACDFRLGAQGTQMAIPAARLGLHYHAGGMQRLVSRLGPGPAKRLLLAGQTLTANDMHAVHYLDELHPSAAALEAAVDRWSKDITQLAPLALVGMKRHLNALIAGEMDPLALAADTAACAQSADLQEGVAAWQARRTPRFNGR